MEKRIKLNSKRSNSRFEFLKKENHLLNSKRSQVAIFVILALIVVVSIALIFLLFRGPEVVSSSADNPQLYMDSCIREFTNEAVELLSKQGGDINPEGSIMYHGENITYLCYTANYYKTCINQRPMLIEHIESEIKRYIAPKVNECFNSLKTELEKKNYIVEMGGMSLTVLLKPKQAAVDIKRNVRITKNEKDISVNSFKTTVNTPIYDFAEIAMEIANQESRYCNFENLGFMIIYPQYDIRKERIEDSLIYTIKEASSVQEFKFATRSCAMPAGL